MTKNIYFSNRKEYYRRQKIAVALRKYNREVRAYSKAHDLSYLESRRVTRDVRHAQKERKELVWRQSVAYTTNSETDVGKTYRAVIYTKFPHVRQEQRLKNYLDKRISNTKVWDYVGYEMQQMGNNDLKGIELNKLYFEVD